MTLTSAPVACWALLAAAVALFPLPTAGVARARRLAAATVGSHGSPFGSRWRPRTDARTVTILAAGGAGLAAAAVRGPALGMATSVLVATIAAVIRSRLRDRAAARRRRELLLAIRLLVGELEAGAGQSSALAAAAEAAPSGATAGHAGIFAAAARAAASGRPAQAMLAEGGPEYQPVAHAWSLAESAGVPLAAALTSVAGDLAARDAQAREVVVALAGARSSALLVGSLPLLGIGLGAAMGARPMSFLLDSPAGRLVCGAGLLLDAAGIAWTQRIIHGASRA